MRKLSYRKLEARAQYFEEQLRAERFSRQEDAKRALAREKDAERLLASEQERTRLAVAKAYGQLLQAAAEGLRYSIAQQAI